MQEYPDVEVRLLEKLVEVAGPLETPCLVFIGGATNNAGYGQIMVSGRRVGTHRVAYELWVGPIDPPEQWVLHHCDVPSCCRPEHLFLGDARVNAEDKVRKGRHNPRPVRGELHPMARLSERDVGEIKWLLREGHLVQREIAEQYDIGHTMISDIKLGKKWRDVQPIEPPPLPKPVTTGFLRRA